MNDGRITPQGLRFLLTEQAERFKKMDLGYPRDVLETLESYVPSPHVVVITGLRRSGKSTVQAQLAQRCFPTNYYYLNFDDERWTGFEAAQFNQVHETLMELFGEKKYFLMDEVQNVPGWELFVRRLHDAGHKLIITGSNASLMSREIGTHLTGRHQSIELFPFSFTEYLGFKNVRPTVATTADFARLKRAFREYLRAGGLPDAVKYADETYCAQLYQDIIYRDISARYSLDSLKSLKEAALFLLGNVGRPISYNKLKQMLMLGSVNTVKAYVEYLESSWLFFAVNVYSPSVKQQQIAPKKVYCIDNGMIEQVAFHSSDDTGWLLENLTFLHLRRQTPDIFYAKNEDGSEVDFLVQEGRRPVALVQVAASIRSESTRKRELTSLFKALKRYKVRKGYVVTMDDSEVIREGKNVAEVVSAADWFGRTRHYP